MKRFLYAAAFLLGLSALFVSCNKENGGSSSGNLIGTWRLVKEEYYTQTDGLKDVVNYDVNKDKIVFNESTMIIWIDDAPMTLAYEYDSSTKTIYVLTGSFSVQKLTTKELVLKTSDDPVKWSVLYLEK